MANMDNQRSSGNTKILFSSEARKALFKGLKIAAEAVTCTLGPKGRTVIIQRQGASPIVTKDGVSVAKSIRLKDPAERMGAELIKEAAGHTNDAAGDGTTTATVLTFAMVQEGMKLLEASYSPQELCASIEQAVGWVVDELKASAKTLTTSAEVAQVGTISANGDARIGSLIAEAMERVTRDGIITVEDAKGMATSMDVVEGMQFDRGYLSPYFVTNPDRMQSVYSDAYVLVTDKKLTSLRELVPVLEAVVKSQGRLLIIADEVEGDAMQGLVLNRVNANLNVVAIKAPGFGQHKTELLNDICCLTGATLVSSAIGLKMEDVKLTHLGKCKKIVVDAKSTTLVGSGVTKDAVANHVESLRSQLADINLSTDDVTKLKMRIAKLASGVAIIKVGGSTEVEMTERKFRVEDALNATRAAVEEGIVPGGGSALFNASIKAEKNVTEHNPGAWIVFKACKAPVMKIAKNAGVTPEVIVEELKKQPTMGYNAASESFVNMVDAGIIDPLKVTRSALQHAASVAITFLSLDAVVCEDNDEDDEEKR